MGADRGVRHASCCPWTWASRTRATSSVGAGIRPLSPFIGRSDYMTSTVMPMTALWYEMTTLHADEPPPDRACARPRRWMPAPGALARRHLTMPAPNVRRSRRPMCPSPHLDQGIMDKGDFVRWHWHTSALSFHRALLMTSTVMPMTALWHEMTTLPPMPGQDRPRVVRQQAAGELSRAPRFRGGNGGLFPSVTRRYPPSRIESPPLPDVLPPLARLSLFLPLSFPWI